MPVAGSPGAKWSIAASRQSGPSRCQALIPVYGGSPAAYVNWEFFHFMSPNEYKNASQEENVGMCQGDPVGPRKQPYQGYVDKLVKHK
jgi:hypothetical protein